MLNWGDNKNKEYYWAVVLEPGSVQAGVWEIVGEKAEVISVSPPASWEIDSELVGAADTALSSTVQTLPEDIKEPTKTVFGVPPSWVDKGQIRDEYLSKIKTICVELSLEPTGFVVLPEAIAHFVKVEEGAPLNATIVGIGKDFLEITVFKLGNLIGTTQVARSVSVFEDVVEGLSRFSALDTLPPRIILYDSKEGELDEAKQSLVAAGWENLEKIKVLHTPKIEIMAPEKKVLATSLAGASEIAGVVSVEKPENGPSPEELGFVVEEDVAAKPVANVPEEVIVKKRSQITFFSKIKQKLSSGKKLVFVSGGALVVFAILFFVFWWFYPKANVKIFVNPRRFEEKTQISIDLSGKELDLSQRIILGEILSTEVSGEKTKSTTGTKRVGDKARGSVKIQNGTASILNLPAGTLLVSANDLKFSTASSASVSAALSPSNPGTQIVDVAASDIGAEYNLAKDEIFKIANYPKAEVDGVSTADFTGGSSREISAVSSDDIKSLTDSLTSELTDNAKKNLLSSLSVDKVFIEDSLVATASSKVFSNKVGDEATNVKLSLGLKVNAISVKKEDLISLAAKVLEGSAPSGFVLKGDEVNFDFSKVGTALFDLRIVANYLPQENLQSLAKEMSGKKTSQVEERLTSIPGFSRAEMNIKPKLPGPFGTLPKIPKNITIEIVNER